MSALEEALKAAKNKVKATAKKVVSLTPPSVQEFLGFAKENPVTPQLDRPRVIADALSRFKWGNATPQELNEVMTKVGQFGPRERESQIVAWVQSNAITPDQANALLNNKALSTSGTSMAPASPPPTPQANTFSGPMKSYEDFKKMATPIFQKYEIPPAVGFGQFAAEGRLTSPGAQSNNFYNIGAFDSNPGAAMKYGSPEEGVTAYAKLLSGQYKLPGGQTDMRYKPAYDARKNPREMIKKIQDLGYASRPDYADFVMQTPEFNEFYP